MATRSIQRSEGAAPAPRLEQVVPARWVRRFLARRDDELDAHLRQTARTLVGADAGRVEHALDSSLALLGRLLEADRVWLFVRRGLLDGGTPSQAAAALVPHRVWTPGVGLAPADPGFCAASSLLVPCPGPEGPLALIGIDRSGLAHGIEDGLSERLEGLGLLFGGALDRLRLASELERAERDRGHVERLETLGRVASAVAHDFNNVITAILGYSDLLEMEIEATGRGGVELDEIRDAAHRAAGLVEQVLAFGRTRRSGAEPIEVEATISDLEGMLRQVLGERIELVFDWAPEAERSRVFLDPGRLGPVVLNLASNARGALEGVESGARFRLSTRRVRIDHEHPVSHSLIGLAEPGPGDYVRLTATDNGCGLSEELARRVFEPFFTTKSSGTGLGLASTLEFVRQAGGGLGLDSAPGAGASFHLYLPIVPEPTEVDPSSAGG